MDLKIGEFYYSVNDSGKRFEVVRYHYHKKHITGYYLVCFDGDLTKAVYFSKLKGNDWFNKYWCKSYEEVLEKEVDIMQGKLNFLKRMKEERENSNETA